MKEFDVHDRVRVRHDARGEPESLRGCVGFVRHIYAGCGGYLYEVSFPNYPHIKRPHYFWADELESE